MGTGNSEEKRPTARLLKWPRKLSRPVPSPYDEYTSRFFEMVKIGHHAIKTAQAQSRIILGPYHDALHEPAPGEALIPPVSQWR